MLGDRRIPAPTVQRLAAYLTCLREMQEEGASTVSSDKIAQRAGSNAAQVRKDLSHLGQFGKPGVGYQVAGLRERIARTLGLARVHRVLLVGVGSLGRALCLYPGFRLEGFDICAAFDNAPDKVGRKVGDLEIYPVEELPTRNRSLQARMAIIAVPASAAQAVAQALVQAGVNCILNFAPVRLEVPQHVAVGVVDLTRELAVLSYYLRTQLEQ